MSQVERLAPTERNAAIAIASIFFLRMLGLFMLLPVLALYADELIGATPFLIGLALGIYGLSQAAMQIPFGRVSDRKGRKPTIALGLALFSFGGLVAAFSDRISFIILGRALQGAGAVSGSLLALAADVTRANQRTKVMAIIGVSIGLSFSVAIALGPALDALVGLSGLFLIAAGLGVIAQALLWFAVPNAPISNTADRVPAATAFAVDNAALKQLYLGVFSIHAMLAACFVALPYVLLQDAGIGSGSHYRVYVPALLLSLLCTGPMIMWSHRAHLAKTLNIVAVMCVAGGQLALYFATTDLRLIALALAIFFVGFNFLEASQPSRVSKIAPADKRGAALGTYATAQFLGMFAGGLLGGLCASAFGYRAVFLAAGAGAVVWLIGAVSSNYSASSEEQASGTDTESELR